MDPITAFSLVCGVIQIVDFSTKTVGKCVEIYKQGSLPESRDLEEVAKLLVDARARLDLSSTDESNKNTATPNDQVLLELAGQCSSTADQLIEKLAALKIKGPHKKRQAILKTVRLLWEQGDIQTIQKRLDVHRNALDTQILISMRQRLDLVSLKQDERFHSLDQSIKSLINTLLEEPRYFEELRDLIQDANKDIRKHITSVLHEQESHLAEKDYRARLRESLWFPEILSREETIVAAHKRTFQWIFDTPGPHACRWDNFSAWLERGEGIYWISGKAGSGKSTLMNFLCQDERTKEALTTWSGTKDMIMLKFFFWNSGFTMQKSFLGLLRSLLWQILYELRDTDFVPPEVVLGSLEGERTSRDQYMIRAWTSSRLQVALQEAIRRLQSSFSLCFFIDGLDEFDEDDDELVAFVQKLASNGDVKVCSSSRPHKVFEDAFGSSAKLRLQELTYKDIQQYVDDKFQDVPQLKSMMSENKRGMDQVKQGIVERAEGVFLWVSLAVKDQIRGLRNEDSPEQLQQRLVSLPREVEDVYRRMLEQIEKTYRQEALCFLRMALCAPGWSVLEHALASYRGLESMLWSTDEIPIREIILLSQSTRRKLITRCLRLLEVHQYSDDEIRNETLRDRARNARAKPLAVVLYDAIGQSYQSGTQIANVEALKLEVYTEVYFVHRTAADFLRNLGSQMLILDTNLPPDFQPETLYVQAMLGKLRLVKPHRSKSNKDGIHVIMNKLAMIEDRTGIPQTRLCELIDHNWSLLVVPKEQAKQVDRTSRFGSISRDSFRPSMSEPTTSGKSDAPFSNALTFLEDAAFHGLSLYLQQALDRPGKYVSPELLNKLLYRSAAPPPWKIRMYQGSLRAVPWLLRRGANPNAIFRGRTIWETFLERMIDQSANGSLLLVYRKFSNPNDCVQPLIPSITAFIECGADVETIWTFQYPVTAWQVLGSCDFDLQVSALSAIELFMKYEPEWPEIREMCNTRGAVRYSRCTELIADKSRSVIYQLSEHQSKDFIKILGPSMALGRTRAKDVRTILGRQLLKFCTGLDENVFGSLSWTSIEWESDNSPVPDCGYDAMEKFLEDNDCD